MPLIADQLPIVMIGCLALVCVVVPLPLILSVPAALQYAVTRRRQGR